MKFQDKAAIVTGGANGIGRCLTEYFLEEGACVAIIDVDVQAGERLAEKLGERFMFFAGDVGEEATLNAFVEAVLSRFPKVHYLINNAMAFKGGILSAVGYEDFTYALRVGVTAPYYLAMKLKNHLGSGAAIVNISSSRSAQSQPDGESYAAGKGGIVALTHALNISLAGTARVNAIAPGWIDVSQWHEDWPIQQHSGPDCLQHPVGRVGKAEDIAKLALFLCSEDAGFISGQEIFADGGMSKLMIYHDTCGWSYKPDSK